uniref:Uncharacterized protein n=1 Tax=Picea glauca TaxID=3330 RepID=A0A117NJE4_PICGL|nr:hypothetical protein ABT39_MTgene1273 [Picea glauca]QHR88263.1 hypothetical protein Q903MT_gene2276 [Picea sitchensis]
MNYICNYAILRDRFCSFRPPRTLHLLESYLRVLCATSLTMPPIISLFSQRFNNFMLSIGKTCSTLFPLRTK